MGTVVRYLIYAGLIAVGVKVFVWWIEPQMAFYPVEGVQDVPSAAFTDVRIPTADGETLHGWWLDHPSPRAQVVFFHGNGGNLSMWLGLLAEMRQRRFSVLGVDYRGYGASTGAPSEQGLYRDADATLRTFAERFRRTGIPAIYWGRSIGTPVAAYAAARAAPDALVLDSPFPDAGALLTGNPLMRFFYLFSSYSFPTSRFLQQYDGPLLVIHGDSDSIAPFSGGREVFDGAPSARKTFAPMKGADHNDLDAVDPESYWEAVDRFTAGLGAK